MISEVVMLTRRYLRSGWTPRPSDVVGYLYSPFVIFIIYNQSYTIEDVSLYSESDARPFLEVFVWRGERPVEFSNHFSDDQPHSSA